MIHDPASGLPLKGKSIICLAGEDWWYHPVRSRRQIMSRLAAANRVLFVNSIGAPDGNSSRANFRTRLKRKIRSWARGLRQVSPNLHVFSPIALPDTSDSLVGRINRAFLALQIRAAAKRCRMDKPIVWVGLPGFAPIIERLDPCLVVFHASDRFDAYDEATAGAVRNNMAACIHRADLVIAVSEPLARMARDCDPAARVEIIDHGVDVELLAQALNSGCQPPRPLENIPRPILGYVGTLEKFQDRDLIEKIAQLHPDWHLVFVGPDSEDLSALRQYPNIHFLPQCPADEIPRYLAAFDLCILPRRIDEWVIHSNPLKFKEYLAAGREVVTTDIPALRPWKDCAWFASDHAEFISACEAVILRGESRIQHLDPGFLARESWDSKTRQVAKALAALCGKRIGS